MNRQPDFRYYVIYDTKTKSYGIRQPMPSMTDAEMVRQVTNLLKDPSQFSQNELFTNAEDFQLFSIGDFCKKTGTLDSWQPQHIANFHELKSTALEMFKKESALLKKPELVQ